MNTTAQQLIAAEIRLSEPIVDAKDLVEVLVANATKIHDDGRIEVIDQNGYVRVRSDGSDMTVSDLIAEIKQTKPGLFQARNVQGLGLTDSRPNTVTTPSNEAELNVTETMRAELAHNRTRAKEQALTEATRSGNPWASRSWNFTRQMTIENLDSALAAQLKTEAGVA